MHRYAKPVAAAVAMALAGVSGAALAADAPAGPKLSDIFANSGITATGYVAASYFHSSTDNGDHAPGWHQFDVGHDTFQLDQAGLTVAYQPTEGFGALVNVIAGEDAKVVNFAEGGSSGSSFNVTQAFVQYATGGLTVMGGKFVTLAGAEVIAPTGNTNFSRSLLFFTEPLTHTGLRATYKFSDAFSLTAGVNNGWNTTHDSTGGKTAEIGISITPIPLLSVGINGYRGNESQAGLPDGTHELLDFVLTIKPSDALNFVVNYDYHKQDLPGGGEAKYQGIAGYVNWSITDQFRVSLRGEVLDDKDGFLSGTDQKIKEATLTFGYMPATNFELRLEGRYDKSGDPIFLKTDLATVEDKSTELAVQGLFKF